MSGERTAACEIDLMNVESEDDPPCGEKVPESCMDCDSPVSVCVKLTLSAENPKNWDKEMWMCSKDGERELSVSLFITD